MQFGATRAEAEALGPNLQALASVAQTRFVPREQALATLKQQAGMDTVIAMLNQNPLPDAWVLQMAPDTSATAQESLAQSIQALPKVERVQIDSAWVRRMEALARFLKLGLILLAATLGAAVVAVIFNTVRLQVLTQRDEIELARLIGATNRYIRRPFYYLGSLQGFVGGALALALVGAALIPLNRALGDFARLYASDFVLRLPGPSEILLFLLAAAVLGWLGATFSTSQHLRNSA
jgi:cell division transport system permease protein